MTVLIVEDDGATRELVGAQVKKLGYLPVLARNGAEALEMLRDIEIRLVITDWLMPEMDGLELCKRIRAAGGARYTYILFLTAVDRKSGYVEGLKAGADDFLTKPCSLEELKVRLTVADRILSLQSEAQQLSRLLPICPRCKKIRAEGDQWQQVETYLMKRTDAQFSHGICPECVETVLKPQIEQWKKRKRRAANG